MAIATRATELLGIKHPILLAPMDLIADGQLAAAVSQAGGFGIIGGGYGDQAWLEREMDAAGSARVGVGFITWSLAKQPHLLDVALKRRPAAIMLSFGDVGPHAPKVKEAGALLICQVQTLEQALHAAVHGADILVAQGAEAGGHGMSRSTMPFVPAVVDTIPGVPVVAAGGIADGRGLAAALMLGADGVLLGTRFYATQEAAASGAAKGCIVAASGDDTTRGILFDIARDRVWPAPYTGRVLRNGFSEAWRGREGELMQRREEVGARYDEARAHNDFSIAALIVGEAVDLVNDVPPAAEVVRRVVAEAEARLTNRAERFRIVREPRLPPVHTLAAAE
ncbi:NAD(P)H-dependent flavin oxidoreductase [Chelatococcus reniformis]|uniref:2-nitropropane dioxygenase n=1 Tax=Chelatococcus reniformis TaxID=1494448 RepID=A0A916XAL9_9HYPH|nr:nitronate monooxygenase [Chelatococcus reniformis]GGC59187.1 2-nitropropane dioxygenase [Chelatococcus reniformis]